MRGCGSVDEVRRVVAVDAVHARRVDEEILAQPPPRRLAFAAHHRVGVLERLVGHRGGVVAAQDHRDALRAVEVGELRRRP